MPKVLSMVVCRIIQSMTIRKIVGDNMQPYFMPVFTVNGNVD
jgi:hypothetical protein